MGRVEWLKWVLRYGRPQTRLRQIRAFLAFEVYYQFCKLRGYRIEHMLKTEPLSAGKYVLVRPPLPLSIRLINKIFPTGRDAHARYVPYTSQSAAEIRNNGSRIELVEISPKLDLNESLTR
jgi:hypothetical protein